MPMVTFAVGPSRSWGLMEEYVAIWEAFAKM